MTGSDQDTLGRLAGFVGPGIYKVEGILVASSEAHHENPANGLVGQLVQCVTEDFVWAVLLPETDEAVSTRVNAPVSGSDQSPVFTAQW